MHRDYRRRLVNRKVISERDIPYTSSPDRIARISNYTELPLPVTGGSPAARNIYNMHIFNVFALGICDKSFNRNFRAFLSYLCFNTLEGWKQKKEEEPITFHLFIIYFLRVRWNSP
jgi:hypothetical protein